MRYLTNDDLKLRLAVVTESEELKKLSPLTQYAFFPSPDSFKRQDTFFENYQDSFIIAVYDEAKPDQPIGTATSIPMTQNVRGKIFPMSGVANIFTDPAYRRRHITTKMMKMMLNNDLKVGNHVSTLYPFKESFYAKFGYITLPQARIATLKLQKLSPLLTEKSPLKFEKIDYLKNWDKFYNFLVEYQHQTHGMGLKPSKSRKSNIEIQPSHLVFVYDENDKIISSLLYTTTGFEGEMRISSFLYLNSKGKYDLLRYLATHIDQFMTAKFPLAPYEYPENWLTDLKIQIANRQWIPAAMARIVNVMGLNNLSVGSGSCTIKVLDTICEWNTGVFTLTSNGGKLEIMKNDLDIKLDCVITITGLTALVYGFYDLEDFIFKKWISDVSYGCFDKLEALFPKILPFIYDRF